MHAYTDDTCTDNDLTFEKHKIVQNLLQVCTVNMVFFFRTAFQCFLVLKDYSVHVYHEHCRSDQIGQISIKPSSKKHPCGICGRKAMANAVLCKSCGNWIYGRCAKIKG